MILKTIAVGIIVFFSAWFGAVLTVLHSVGAFQGMRVPIVDAYYERKQIKENNKYNDRILQAHREYFGEEPVVDWKE